MNRFRYLRDPLFWVCCGLYALNRWYLKPHTHNLFLRGYFNDTLLIPCALPPILLIHRWLKLRPDDREPTFSEVCFHLVVWSILFEGIGPHIMPHTTGDPWDVAAYVAGGLLAWLWWHRERVFPQLRTHEL